MIRPRSVSLTSILAILFVSFAIPAFANRGGGGGGFHGGGGGGFHGGGGSRSGAGGFQGGSFRGGSSAPRMSAGFSRPAQSAPMRSGGGSFARPGGGNVNRSYANSAAGSQRMGNSSSAPAAMADGQWHSFGNPAGGRAGAADAPQSQASSGTGGGFHVFAGNRSAAGVQSTRSFSGQGNQVWENASIPRNAVSSSRALSNIRGSFGNSPAGATGLRSGSALLPNSELREAQYSVAAQFPEGWARTGPRPSATVFRLATPALDSAAATVGDAGTADSDGALVSDYGLAGGSAGLGLDIRIGTRSSGTCPGAGPATDMVTTGIRRAIRMDMMDLTTTLTMIVLPM